MGSVAYRTVQRTHLNINPSVVQVEHEGTNRVLTQSYKTSVIGLERLAMPLREVLEAWPEQKVRDYPVRFMPLV